MLYYAENVTRLGEVLEKLHASRCVEEQVAHNDCCAFRTAAISSPVSESHRSGWCADPQSNLPDA